MTVYNYDAFSHANYDFATQTGPMPGDRAPDFELSTPDGKRRRLLDFEGGFLVLEMGSITCPLFQSRRPVMENLSHDQAAVSHVVLYVREAHPGAGVPGHTSQEEKRACAKRLQVEDGETRTVLVDDLDGTAHSAYGGMPNAVFIINRNGCVLFRLDWNNPSATAQALRDLEAGRPAQARGYFRPAVPAVVFRTLGRAGKGSAGDFFRSLPALICENVVKRNLRLLFGRPAGVSPDTVC